MAFLLLMTRIMSDITASLLRGLQYTVNSLLIDIRFNAILVQAS